MFTFYRFLHQKWISGEANAIEGVTAFEIVFRVPCRDVLSTDVNYFYELEFKNSKKMFQNTSSLHEQLRKYNTLWIMDGFDESTAAFKGFLKAVLIDLPDNHKIIITTRPAPSTQLLQVEGIGEKRRCELTLEKFDENQIKEVARKRGIDVDKFDRYYGQLQYKDKIFLETPLNLNLVLQLWTEMDNLNFEDLNTNKLYKFLFEKRRKGLVKRLKGRAHIDDRQLELSVEKWFHGLCKCAAFSIVQIYFNLRVDQSHIVQLTDDAVNSYLIADDCLSSFLDFEESSDERRYHYTHVIQKETLASIHLSNCKEDELNFICDLTHEGSLSVILRYCNEDAAFLRFYKRYYERRYHFIFCDVLLSIAREKKERFKHLKIIFSNSEKKPSICSIYSPRDLSDILQLLLPEITLVFCNLEMNICDLCYDEWKNSFATLNNDQWNDAVTRNRVPLDNWLDVLHEYKDKVNFSLRYHFSIRSNDDVKKMATKVSEPFSDSRFKSSVCFRGAELHIKVYGGDAEFLVKALSDVAKNCDHLLIALHYEQYEGQDKTLDSNLLSLFFASKVDIYTLKLNIDSFKEFQLQLLNASKLQFFRLYARDADNKRFSEFFKKINWAFQTELINVYAFIRPKHLKCLYKNIPEEIARKTRVFIDNPLALEAVPLPEGKTFQRMRIKSPNDETYKALRKIADSILDRTV